jgi:hypothetical protein
VIGAALGLAEPEADGLALAASDAEVDGAGLAEAAGSLSFPHAPRASRTVLSPTPTRARVRATRRIRTGEGYRGQPVTRRSSAPATVWRRAGLGPCRIARRYRDDERANTSLRPRTRRKPAGFERDPRRAERGMRSQ